MFRLVNIASAHISFLSL